MRVGVAGLGRMGAHMARNLARAGHDVTLWNRSAAKAHELALEIGCAMAETPAALSNAAEVVITMLADDAASTAVHEGPEGLFAGSAQTFLEMGTMSPDHIAGLRARAPEGVRVIDAPVSGATQAAQEATLTIMAGCDADEAGRLSPIFEALGKTTIALGAPGQGAVMKLAVNALLHGINQSFAEAMTLSEAAGIETARAFDVIEASAACAPMLRYRRPLYLDEAGQDVTFTVALARKDMGLALDLARQSGIAMPTGAVTLARLEQAEAAGFGPRDMAAMLAFNREDKT
ncbi:3-hydroxyisobutyrate dehydrogenase [Roseivivax lentus]|uniref:3-hydroxyisobutyrate dehydrogenase n=1 Tax=Roseivivax lentus TaxID=633194 RepID=A0A1N7P2M9_9RHOB|nr:NAD(P)-dependent oxidoreductase [Roseivivax lentus]SIT04796.1 3-hydroxyisobutyrate dehydrogenase [Roseivivax lentus]